MSRKRARQSDANSVAVDMSSLVDLSFLLLVFFLVTTTLLAKEQDLPMTMPAAGMPGEGRPVRIRVEADNQVVLHPGQSFQEVVAGVENERELPILKERLSLLKAGRAGVQLDVRDGASYQRFMDVLNCLQGAGWDEVAITQL